MAYLGVPQSKLENLTTNVQIVNLSASFDGTTTTFNLQDSRGDAVYAVHERALLVILGGITQRPGVDYTTSGTTITFTTAPVSNLTIAIRKLYGVQRIIGVNDGVISPVKLSTGGPVWNSSGNVTISGDLNVTGAFNAGGNGLFWEDNEKANFGSNNDLQIYHSGVNSFIRDAGTGSLFIEGTDLTLRAADSTTRYLVANETNGDVSLFHGNSIKFATTSTGIDVTGEVQCDTLDVDGAANIQSVLTMQSYIQGTTTLNLYGDSSASQGISLDASGNVTLQANLDLQDNDKILLGNGDDLQIFHDGNNISYVANYTGELILLNQTDNGDISIHSDNGSGGTTAYFRADGSTGNAILYHYGTEKLATTSTGAKVTGALEVTQEYPTIRPTLDLNFAATKTLDRRITFTRDSLGTYTDDMGILKYASNNTPRFDHDPTTGESLGLLIEESRTNNFTQSNVSNWSNSGVTRGTNTTQDVSPEGLNTATIISESTNNGLHRIKSPNISFTDTRTFSVWIKRNSGTRDIYINANAIMGAGLNFDFDTETLGSTTGTASFERYPNQWYRFILTGTGTGNINGVYLQFTESGNEGDDYYVGNSSNSFLVWGAQLEVGSFVTSHIPTAGSTVTRAQDFATITGTNFTDFYNDTEGSLYSDFSLTGLDPAYNSTTVMLTNNTTTNYLAIFGHNPVIPYAITGGSQQFSASLGGSSTTGVNYRAAMAYKLNDFAASLDGGTVSTDTSATIPPADRMLIGRRVTLNKTMNGYIRALKYYNKRLPNAQLQGLTQQ